jgi:hypothetical protein
MKKHITIVILIATGLSLYLIFRKSDKSNINHKSIMPDTISGESVPDVKNHDSGPQSQEESRIGNEILNENREETSTVSENSISFTAVLKGEYKVYNFKAIKNFTKITASPQFTGYTASFVENLNAMNLSDQSTFKNVISMMLPLEIGPGTYNEKSENFIFQYIGSDKGVMYSLDQTSPFELTLTEWGGPGGRARGTFSVKLRSFESTEPVYIQDGRFDIGIQR